MKTVKKARVRPGKTLTGGAKPKVQKERARSWTAARRKAFLAELAATCNVAAAVKAAGLTHCGSVYALRSRSAEFRAQWAEALREGYAKLELMLLERAMNGTVKTVERPDGSIDKTHEYPNQIALQLLRMHKDNVAETEREYDPAELDEVRRRIGRKLEALKKRRAQAEAGGEDAVPSHS